MNDNIKQHKGQHNGLESTKSILLVLLIALAILQTSGLWFAGTSRSFFDVFFGSQQIGFFSLDEIESWSEYFVTPTKVLTSRGDNRFAVNYAPDPTSIENIWHISTAALSMQWDYISTFDVSIFNQRAILYVYNFYMPTHVFMEHFQIQEGTYNLQNVLPFFNNILFVPSTLESNIVYLYFVGLDNQNNNIMVKYTITTPLHSALVEHVQAMPTTDELNRLYYSSTELFGFDFNQNMFLPRWREGVFTYYVLDVERIMEGAVLGDIAPRLSIFFSNPSRVWDDYSDGSFTLGDYHSVVTLYNDRVEYTNHGPIAQSQGFLRDFDIAKNFLNWANMLDNQQGRFFLSRFYPDINSTTFYFDYVINNIPVHLYNSRDEHGHWASVTVSGGVVTNFNQILLNLSVSDTQANEYIDLIMFADGVEEDLNRPIFGYILDREEKMERLFVTWIDVRNNY